MPPSALADRRPLHPAGSTGVSALRVRPVVLSFWHGWPGKLTPTDSTKIFAVPIYSPMSSKRPRKNKPHWSFGPAAVDESFMATLSAEGITQHLLLSGLLYEHIY